MAVLDRSGRVHTDPMNTLLRSLALLAVGGVLVASSDPVVAALDMPSPIAGGVMLAGIALGFSLTVWGLLTLTRSSRWERPGKLALGAVGLFVVGIVGHNVFVALTGIEEAVFFLLGVWIAPALLIAAVVRMVRSTHHSQTTGMDPSPR
jgi:hypothetical protein